MNRRRAIWGMGLTVAGGALAFSGYQWYAWYKTPDLDYLDKSKGLIADLASTLIPTTDTPGAREARVEDFIVGMIRDCTDRMTANKFIDGLKELEYRCRSQYQRSFGQCREAERESLLLYFEQAGKPIYGILGKAESRWLGKSFFSTLKAYTVEGYCSSELGMTKGLAYDPIPGHFHGCIPLNPNQRAWATR
jgi:hypothetical protein